jgi:hypothetical protein
LCPEGLRARVDKAGKRWRGAGGADKVIGALAAPFRGDARLITLRAFTSQPPSALSNEAQLMKARNGRSWDDAVPFTAINDTLNRTMQPGDTLPVEGAAYGRVQIVIDSSGTASAPKTIGGEDRGHGLPLFGPANDEWMNWKEHGLLFKAKSNHWIIKNLQFRLYAEPTTCAEGGQTGLVFDNLRVLRAYTGFKLMDCHDTVVRNCCATRRRQQPLKGVKNHRSTQRGRSATKSECCKRLRACPEIGFAASLLAAFGKPITSGATASRLAVSTKTNFRTRSKYCSHALLDSTARRRRRENKTQLSFRRVSCIRLP